MKTRVLGARKVLLIIAIVLPFFTTLFFTKPFESHAATVPSLVNYQGTLTDSQGSPLTGAHNLHFRIWSDPISTSAGYLLWQEIHNNVPMENGQFNVILGSEIDSVFNAQNRYMGISLDSSDVADEIKPRQQILSTPYAIRAENAAKLDNPYLSNIDITGNITATGDVSARNGVIRMRRVQPGGPYTFYSDYGFYLYNGSKKTAALYYRYVTSIPPTPVGGILELYNDNGTATLVLNGQTGQKNFVINHPDNPDKKIVYTSLEGPEAAAYERGTTQMSEGEAWVSYSDHFSIVVNPETVTVQLTPLSADSFGLSVVEKSENGFRIKELYDGTGNYRVDYFAQGVRKGHEDYQPIRDK